MKDKGKYTGVIVAAVLVVLGIIFAIGIAVGDNATSKYTAYKSEAITILEKYKDGKYDEEEARERLDDLESDVWNAKIESASKTDKDKYEYLQSELNSIIRSLKKGAVRVSDVDITIRHIKNGK